MGLIVIGTYGAVIFETQKLAAALSNLTTFGRRESLNDNSSLSLSPYSAIAGTPAV